MFARGPQAAHSAAQMSTTLILLTRRNITNIIELHHLAVTSAPATRLIPGLPEPKISGTVAPQHWSRFYAQASPRDVQSRAGPAPHREGQIRHGTQLPFLFRRDPSIPRPCSTAAPRPGYAEMRGMRSSRPIRGWRLRAARELIARGPAEAGLHSAQNLPSGI